MTASSMKTFTAGAALLLTGLAGGWLLSQWRASAPHVSEATAPAPTGERRVLYWYDPMVPTQKFDKPGKSPFMEMQLVPRYADEAGGDGGTGVAVSAQAVQSLGLRVATAEKRLLLPTLDIVGTVGLNEREVSVVQARANGFVERVYARAPGDV
ncbi:MAG: heavy metal-binding domain-containing protein, partial [Methylibium sp.]